MAWPPDAAARRRVAFQALPHSAGALARDQPLRQAGARFAPVRQASSTSTGAARSQLPVPGRGGLSGVVGQRAA